MKNLSRSLKNICLCLALFFPFGIYLQAQSTTQNQDTLSIDLKKALEIALSENPTIKIANMEITRVDYAKKESWYGLIPTIDGTGNYTRNIKPQTMVMAGQKFVVGQDNSVTLGLSAGLPLIAPGLWRSIQMSELEMQMALEKVRASQLDLIAEVKKAYNNVLLAEASYQALKEGYGIAEQNYKESKDRFEQGIVSEYDFVSAEVQMRNLIPSLLQMGNAIDQAKMMLKVFVGLDMRIPIKVAGNLADLENQISFVPDLQQLSLDNNSDLKQLDIQKNQLKKQLQLQQTQLMPTLAAFGSFTYMGSGYDDDFNTEMMGIPVTVPAGMNWYDPSIAVGLQLNVPIFHGFTKLMQQKQTKIRIQELDLQKDYLRSNLDVQVVSAVDNMKKATEQVESNKKNVELAEKGYKISQKRYETGIGTMLELRNSTLALTEAKLSYSRAIADYLNAKADLEKVLGQENKD